MKVKVIGKIKKDGTFDIGTVKGAGGDCKRIADIFATAVGKVDESSRGDTPDLHEDVKTEQDIQTDA